MRDPGVDRAASPSGIASEAAASTPLEDAEATLCRIMDFVLDDERMQHWDRWRAYIAKGGKASLPRDDFEAMLGWIAEEVVEYQMRRLPEQTPQASPAGRDSASQLGDSGPTKDLP